MSEKGYKERRKHSTESVPFSYYESKIPDYFPNTPLHWHDEFEINRIILGSGEFICGDKHFIAHAGDIIIIPPDTLHAVNPVSNNSLVYNTLVFNSCMLYSNVCERSYTEFFLPLISNKITIPPLITSSCEQYNILLTLSDYAFTHAKAKNSISDILLKSNILSIFGTLFESGLYQQTKKSSKKAIDIIRPALEYIQENYTKNITIAQLAQISHLSQSYLMSSFKKAIGICALEYVCQLRIKTACEMLRNSKNNISDIAFECGFSNLSNFNRKFKQKLGTTPSNYRKTIALEYH